MNPQLRLLLIGAGVIIGLGFLARRAVAGGVTAIADINEGTPFEGAGVIGTLGNVADVSSGGILSDIGSFIGNTLADFREGTVGESFRNATGEEIANF